MKHLLSILSSIFLSSCLLAQPAIQWQKTLGGTHFDEAHSIQQTNDGGYIIAGVSASINGDVTGNNGIVDYWVVKLSSDGSIEWENALGGSDDDRPYSVCQTSDNGYIIAGFTQSDNGDVSNNHGDKDAWVVKLAANGELEWEHAYGGSSWDEAKSINQTSDGGFVVAGTSNSNNGDVTGNHGYLDLWILKLSSNGIIEWQKSLGGSYDDIARTIRQTIDSGYIVIGETMSLDGDVSENNGNVDLWVVKLDSNGSIEWQNTLGGSGVDVGSDIVELSDGFIACGFAGSHNTGDVTGHKGLFDTWVIKLSTTGELIWQKTLGGTNGDWGRSITVTNDGMYAVAGETKSKNGDVIGNNGIQVMWLVKLDTLGEIIWQKTLGGSDGEACLSMQQTVDNGYILAGYAWSNDGDVTGVKGEDDFWIVKLAPESTPTTEASNIAPLEIYPNPAHNTITMQTTAQEPDLQITITDMLGRTIQHQPIQNGKNVDVSTLASGMYIITATAHSGKTYSGTFKKE